MAAALCRTLHLWLLPLGNRRRLVVETWIGVGFLAWLLLWVLSRFRLYRGIIVFAALVFVMTPELRGELARIAPVLVGYVVVSFVVFHGRRAVGSLMRAG